MWVLGGRTRREWGKLILEYFAFYVNSFFVVLLTMSVVALIFLVPFFIDPAWSTLKADFVIGGTNCTTVHGEYLKGMYNTTLALSHHVT